MHHNYKMNLKNKAFNDDIYDFDNENNSYNDDISGKNTLNINDSKQNDKDVIKQQLQ